MEGVIVTVYVSIYPLLMVLHVLLKMPLMLREKALTVYVPIHHLLTVRHTRLKLPLKLREKLPLYKSQFTPPPVDSSACARLKCQTGFLLPDSRHFASVDCCGRILAISHRVWKLPRRPSKTLTPPSWYVSSRDTSGTN